MGQVMMVQRKGALLCICMAVTVLLALVLTTGNVWSAESEFEMIFGNATANDAQDETANFFAKEVERLSYGRIKVNVYNAGQLGNSQKMSKDLRYNVQQALIHPTGFSVPYIKSLEVCDMPFLFPNDEVQTRVLNSKASDTFREDARKVGLELMAFFSGGFKNFCTTFPMETAADLKGRKIRAIPAPVLLAQFKAFGCVAVPMPFGELYTALQQGVVEGFENPFDVIHRHKFHEVSKYITVSGHGALSTIILVNKKWLDSLPPDLREAVFLAGQSTPSAALEIYRRHIKKSEDILRKEATVSQLPEAEVAKLRELCQQVWDEVRQDSAKAKVLHALVEEVEAIK